MKFESLTLNKGKEKALLRRHPWVFSGAFKELPASIEDGALVEVLDHRKNFQGMGFFRRGSIAVSLLSFEKVDDIEQLIKQRIIDAIAYRKASGILDLTDTNCCRLVFAEGDRLTGLIIDKYADTAVVQIHHPGWANHLHTVAGALMETGIVSHVYSKPSEKITVKEELRGTLSGTAGSSTVIEHGHKFIIDWEEGQKTGFFLDQRNNRQRLSEFCNNRSVLNTFSYTGGFSVYALAAGASKAVSVDLSQAAIDLANKNAEINGFAQKHIGIAADIFEFFKSDKENFEVIILDPPAFSKSRRTTHNAVQAYKRLNLAGIKKVKAGGFIFTFSCSQHVDFKLFEDTVRAAAIEAKREVRIVERLGQPADHPVNIFHPEGEYLKGLILAVN